MPERWLSIPVIRATPRKGRTSGNVARFLAGEIQKRGVVVTQLVDVMEYGESTSVRFRFKPSQKKAE